MKRLLLISFVLLAGCDEKADPSPTPEQAKAACGANGLKEYRIELIRHNNQVSFTCHVPENSVVISGTEPAVATTQNANMVF